MLFARLRCSGQRRQLVRVLREPGYVFFLARLDVRLCPGWKRLADRYLLQPEPGIGPAVVSRVITVGRGVGWPLLMSRATWYIRPQHPLARVRIAWLGGVEVRSQEYLSADRVGR